MTLRHSLAVAAVLALTGPAEITAASSSTEPSAERVAQIGARFINAVADRDLHACHFLTPNAIRAVKVWANTATCAKAIRARHALLGGAFFGATPGQLVGNLDQGYIRQRDRYTEFRFPFDGIKGRVVLGFLPGQGRLRIDRLSAHRTSTCPGPACPG